MGLCPRHVIVMVAMGAAIDRPPSLSIFHNFVINMTIFLVWWLVMSLGEMHTDIFGSDTAYNLFVKAKHQAH